MRVVCGGSRRSDPRADARGSWCAASEPVIIAEDDLMLASASVPQTQARICRALSDLPASADMVFLEFCFEDCSKADPILPGLSRASQPSCSAAIYFSAKGAKRVSDLCDPVNDVIDRMYPFLIRRGWLEAYLLTPPAFFQDRYFHSNMNRLGPNSLQDHTHGIREGSPLCMPSSRTEQHGPQSSWSALSLPFEAYETRQVGLILRGSDPRKSLQRFLQQGTVSNAMGDDGCGHLFNEPRPRFPGETETVGQDFIYIWVPYSIPLPWVSKFGQLPKDTRLFFSAERADTTFALVGAASLPVPRCGMLLYIEPDNKCYRRPGVGNGAEAATEDGGSGQEVGCALEVSLVSASGVVLEGMTYIIFLSEFADLI